MDGFKDSTKMKYMTEGGTYNERGRRATMGEIAAEDRRMAGRPSEGVSSRPTDASGRRATNAELGMTSSAKKAVGPSSVAVSKVLDGMAKKVVKKAIGGGVDAKLSRGITNAKAAMTAAPRAKPTMVDMLPKNSPLRPSSGNPLMGDLDKPQVSRGPVTDPRANIGNTLEIMKKQGSARELPTPPMMVKGQKINVPPTRGPSMSPAFNDRPMVRRKTGGLSVMPKGKC
jgi:hypothetical protein